MSKPSRALLALTIGMAVGSGPAAGQTHAEGWGGFAVGSYTATAAGLDLAPRLSFQAVVYRGMTPRLGLYGGYARTAFGCEEGFCLDRSLTVTGNHGLLGVQVGDQGPWVRLGLMLGTVAVGSEGEAADLGAGIHGAAGLTLGAGRLRFLPALSYRWLSANDALGSGHAVAMALELGVRYRLR
jgi:hypothetical protein